jgi:hypothetical protein
MHRVTWSALLCVMLFVSLPLHAAPSLIPGHLQVASLTDPVGVESAAPRFGWQLRAVDSGAHDLLQGAYRLLVASSADALAAGRGDVWDSGRVASDDRLHVVYKGTPLRSHTTYYWKVQVWDQDGQASGWSEPAQWTTAILNPGEWTARWIAAEPDHPLEPQTLENRGVLGDMPLPLPIFRKEFAVAKPVRRAVVFVSGLGQYELHLNGRDVTRSVLNPGWTNYRKTVLYNSYDVTALLRQGANAFGALLGNGMYNVPGVKGRYNKFVGSFGQPKLLVQMHILYADGAEATVVSDGSWQTAPGPIVFSSIYGGEDYDARRLQTDWDEPGFAGSGWRAALEVAGPNGDVRVGSELSGHLIPPMVAAETLSPVRVTQPKPGETVYDLGKNSSGWPEIVVRGHAGDRVRMLPGELLSKDGTVTQASANAGPDDPVLFTYTLAGTGEEHWRPRFSYYGFRYVQVDAVAAEPGVAAPTLVSLRGEFVHDDVSVNGEFHAGLPLLNQVHGLIDRAILSNLASVITDCPTREKLGWLEQTHLAGASIMDNYGVLKLYEKLSDDMSESQLANGLVPAIAPEYVAFVDRNGVSTNFRDSPEWGSASILDPWEAYQFYGDAEILAQHYDSMARYAAYLHSRLKNGVLSYGLGDWYDIGPHSPGESQLTGKGLTATAIYYQDLQVLAATARLLGRAEDAERYVLEAASIREAFNRQLFHAETAIYDRGSQTAQAMPLALGLVPENARAAVLAKLVADIRAHGNHVTAGDIGFHYVVRALTGGGRSDVLFDMLTREDSPSYGYQLAKGATTLTEAWDTNPASSQNHFMLGHAEEWFYRGLAGIDLDLSRTAPAKIVIRPAFVAGVPSAEARVETVLGSVESSWKRSGGRIELRVEIPAGARATVVLPGPAMMNGKPVPSNAGGSVIGSGKYVFTLNLQ